MNEKSIFPKPHRYAVCAQEDMPIKEFYKDIFDEVFIFYHPFIKPKSIAYELFNPEDYPSKNEIRDNCEMVNWERFMFLAGLKSIKQLDTGLRTNILGLKSEYQDKKAGKLILEACQKNKIVVPTEGLFPDFIMNTLLHSIKKIGTRLDLVRG
ncbi:DUF2711 family protein [Fictibacillus phosphorivorans]|uniref:DUF2711 family protein n=1 Tax=Fictibacillus phosphorivorans TaxID=1221500 RepID=UPI0035EDE41F